MENLTDRRVSKGKGLYGLAYASKVEQIKKQIGDLEKIRQNLKMSRREICQILLVNPSAWTRWTKSKEGPPAHFYRALEWLIYIHNNRQKSGQRIANLEKESTLTDLKSSPKEQGTGLWATDMATPPADQIHNFNWVEKTEMAKVTSATDMLQKESAQTSYEVILLKRRVSKLQWCVVSLCAALLLLLLMGAFAKGWI